MNILYHTYEKVHSTKGGTERTTVTIASALTRLYDAKCFSIYEAYADTPKAECFDKEYFWTTQKELEKNSQWLRDIIVANRIDCVIIQGSFIHVKIFKQAVNGLKCKVILAHHFEPGSERVFFSFKRIVKARTNTLEGLLKKTLRILLFPYLRNKYINDLSHLYHEAYEHADKVVLLSEQLIAPYLKFGNFDNTDKFFIIPNALSFMCEITKEAYQTKKKIALIVSRLDDKHKNISEALKIWNTIKRSKLAQEWELKIVGQGVDEVKYKKYVNANKIADISFVGRQNPLAFYKEASIFIMTSKSESWGLTLTEAQQMGCVPIAYNTYPTLKDIITDGEDGIIIAKNDMANYEQKLLELITDHKMRHQLAIQGINNCKQFSQDKIAEMWWKLLTENRA